MKKKELTERLAQEARVPLPTAADAVDKAINDVVRHLRNRVSRRRTALERLIDEASCTPEEMGRHAKP